MATVRLPEPATQVELNVDNLDVDLDGAQVLAHQYIYDNIGDNWDRVRGVGGAMAVDTELAPAILAADNMGNPTVPQVLSNLMLYDGGTWDRARGTAADGLLVDTELGAAIGISDDFVTPDAPAVASFGMMYDGGTWDMLRGTSADGLLVNLGDNNDVTTELPAAAALADGAGNPTTPTVGAALLGWNGGFWDRLVSSIANGLQVDVTRMPATAAEGAALPGVFMVVAGDDGADAHPLQQDASGYLKITIEADSVGIGGGVEYTVNAVVPADPVGKAIVVERDDIITTVAEAEADWTNLRGTEEGALWTQDFNSDAMLAALQLLDNTVAVLGTATYTEAASSGLVMAAVRNDILAALADTDNELAPLQVDADGALYVTGTVEHGTADDGAPMKIGGRAQEPEAQPEEVADNDRVDALFDRNGYLRVRGDFEPQYMAINAGAAGDNSIIGAQPAGKRIAVWSLFVISDGTVDVRFEDGAGGTALTGQVPLQEREGYTWPAGGLVPLFVGSAAQTFNMELSAAIQVHGGVSFTVMDD
jgi:hypothetical protein